MLNTSCKQKQVFLRLCMYNGLYRSKRISYAGIITLLHHHFLNLCYLIPRGCTYICILVCVWLLKKLSVTFCTIWFVWNLCQRNFLNQKFFWTKIKSIAVFSVLWIAYIKWFCWQIPVCSSLCSVFELQKLYLFLILFVASWHSWRLCHIHSYAAVSQWELQYSASSSSGHHCLWEEVGRGILDCTQPICIHKPAFVYRSC